MTNSNGKTEVDLAGLAQQIVGRYPAGRSRSALIPLLRLAQERDGHLTRQGIDDVSALLGLAPAEVTAVASFYSMLHRKPKGRRVISVCHNLACTIAGAEDVIAALEKHLGVACGSTTADGEFTLERAECLAFCDKAPMLQVSYDEMVGPLTPESAVTFVESLRVSGEGAPSLGGVAKPSTETRRADQFGPAAGSTSHPVRGPSPDTSPPSTQPTAQPPAPAFTEEEEPLLVESIELTDEEEDLLHPEDQS